VPLSSKYAVSNIAWRSAWSFSNGMKMLGRDPEIAVFVDDVTERHANVLVTLAHDCREMLRAFIIASVFFANFNISSSIFVAPVVSSSAAFQSGLKCRARNEVRVLWVRLHRARRSG
jgi:hypothetical protein